MKEMKVIPAYGRDYRSKAEVIADWTANKDFMVANIFDSSDGRYVNREDADHAGIERVCIRYSRLMKVVFITRKGGAWRA